MKKIYLIIALVLPFTFIYSQGCSDAGFCSIGSMSINKNGIGNKNVSTLRIGSSFGSGEQSMKVTTPYLQFEQQFNSWQVQVKATYNSASLNNNSASGIGDIFLVGIKSFKNKNGSSTFLNAGLKIPIGNEDLKSNGQSLPLAFQPTLGTLDFIAGITYQVKTWDFSTAVQIPLTKNNKNSFIQTALPTMFNGFVSTQKFNRSADFLVRSTKNFKLSNQVGLSTGLLAIYHVADDKFTDNSNKENSINDSKGLTLNLNLGLNWEINKSLSFNLLSGFPLKVRTVRPDGLTRSFVIVPELIWKL